MDFNRSGQMFTLKLRDTEVLITSAALEVLQADADEWRTDEIQGRYHQGLGETRQFWWKPSGPPQVEDLRPQRGVRALVVLEPRCKSSASETESALKAAKFTTALRWINPLLHDLYHLVENFEEQHLVATCSSTRGKEQL